MAFTCVLHADFRTMWSREDVSLILLLVAHPSLAHFEISKPPDHLDHFPT